MRVIASFLLSGCLSLPQSNRAFSLFSVVQFENGPCTSASNTWGTCFAESECSSKGGTIDGNCASGFGVCCTFSTTECTSDVRIPNNRTYIKNPDYPATNGATTAQTCKYSIMKGDDICSIRLDFEQLELAEPDTTTTDSIGDCTVDDLTVAGSTGTDPPEICGSSTGQHMYIDARSTATPTLTFNINKVVATATRRWKVKVSHIPCNTIYTPPSHCTQYFTGASGGPVRSYGFGRTLKNQMYTTCVRREGGADMITWRESDSSATAMPDSFGLLPAVDAMSNLETECTMDFLLIDGTKHCAQLLNEVTAMEMAGPVTSDSFEIVYFTDATDKLDVAPAINTGYSLHYVQN